MAKNQYESTKHSLVLIVLILIVMLFDHQLVIFSKLQKNNVFSLILFITFGFYHLNLYSKIKDALLVSETQNAIFTNFINLETEFCLIIREDSSVIYSDKGFKKYFGQYLKESVSEYDAFLKSNIISEIDQQKIEKIISHRQLSKIICENRENNSVNFRFMSKKFDKLPENYLKISLVGLNQLENYYILKGVKQEEFVTEEKNNDLLKNSVDLIESFSVASLIINDQGLILGYNFSFSNLMKIYKIEDNSFSSLLKEEVDLNILLKQISNSIIRRNIRFINDKVYSTYIIKFKTSSNENFNVIFLNNVQSENIILESFHSQKIHAIGQLAGGIAHDFNNLLTAIIGFCDLLLMRHFSSDISFPDIMQIKQNATRGAALVKQLLAFSRKQVMQPKIFNITQALDDISSLIGRLIGENIDLKISHENQNIKVKLDKGQLEQVIINLAVNARDAMPRGGSLELSTRIIHVDSIAGFASDLIYPEEEIDLESGEYVLIEVRDSGEGIDEHNLKKVFEPFFSTKPLNHGTGLGLSTVLGIIRQMGGYIFLKTKIDEGTSFYILLRLYENIQKENISNQEYERKIEPDQERKETNNYQKLILLVEDESSVREFTTHALTRKKYKVIQASSAEEGIEMMNKYGQEIEIIITDVVMSLMTGPEMIEKIMVNYPNIKVIFISGYIEETINMSNQLEKKNFLPKPFTINQLINKLEEITRQ